MRRSLWLALLLVAGPARAGMLTSASLVLDAPRIGLAPVAFAATAPSGGAAGPTWAGLGSGSAFAGTAGSTIPSTALPPITGIQFQVFSNAQGVFAGATPGGVHGQMDLDVLAHAQSYMGIDLYDLVLSVGRPATWTMDAYGVSATTRGHGWTAGTTTLVLTTPTSQGLGATTRMGSNGLDALGRGTLVLVSGVNIVTNVYPQVPVFVTLTLNYVPEPGTFLLLGSAAAGCLARTRRRP